MFHTIRGFIPPIHRSGQPIIAIALLVTMIFFSISVSLGWLGAIITAWVIFFFRDPHRVPPHNPKAITSPADGIITKISTVSAPAELDLDPSLTFTKVSIFLNVFDVHVNRLPCNGVISKLHYHPGQFLNASTDKSSEENEKQHIVIQTPDNYEVIVSQIAGFIARRIVCDLQQDQEVSRAERFGIIRFGSRVDLYLPTSIEVIVTEGQRMLGGETVMAYSA